MCGWQVKLCDSLVTHGPHLSAPVASLGGAKNKKGRQFSQEKIGMTPSVAAPGDTNPSDATGAL